jgi:ferric-dicitrate binding protein FerR (iron transport regulator)
MNDRLEQFVRDHREEFDAEEPDKKVWEKILQEVDPKKKKQAPLARLDWRRWSAAAAVILLIAGAVWFFSTRTGKI